MHIGRKGKIAMKKVLEIRDYTAMCLKYCKLSHSAGVAETKEVADQISELAETVMAQIQQMRAEAELFR